MSINWYGAEVKAAIMASKKEICDTWGSTIKAEYQMRTPVVSGNMRSHEDYQVHEDNNGVDIGTTPEAEYAIFVEEGSSKQKAQHILQNTINDNKGQLTDIASKIISSKMGS
ncbi:MAG: HK97-gp10 family putative phage morphogenesis protein [Clostridium sp.]|uniref:HK97-gp10 family putative phage morphogenesis protein n=1 Tax=Clostridium sp. TaxID=1506 RepID=UPI0039E737CA